MALAGSALANTGSGGGGSGVSGASQGQAGNGASGVAIVRWCDLVGNAPVWTTAAGSLGTLAGNLAGMSASLLTVNRLLAVDPDGVNVSFSVTSGTLPPGLQLSSTGLFSGVATFTASSANLCVVAPLVYTFSVSAFDGAFYTPRVFSITISPTPAFRNQTFALVGASSFQVSARTYPSTVEVLVVGGGGGGIFLFNLWFTFSASCGRLWCAFMPACFQFYF